MKRQTSELILDPTSIGTSSKVLFHDYFPSTDVQEMDKSSLDWYGLDRAYVQASLHADELPGLLVLHHLIKLLDQAAERNAIRKQITIVPYANPIGSNQIFLGTHLGRFSTLTGVNFNRSWMDVTKNVATNLEGKLSKDDKDFNRAFIRKTLFEEASKTDSNRPEVRWKRELFKKACISSIVLDLHCDLNSFMYIYTHDRLWPNMADLSAAIESRCNILCSESGSNPFDEAYSQPWAILQDKFPDFPIEMACHSATIEVRGEFDVYDHLAMTDAKNLYNFFVRRGYIDDSSVPPLTNSLQPAALPLTGVDMMEVTVPGVLAWKVRKGDEVVKDQLLGEVVNIEDVDAPRTPIIARTSGLVFSIQNSKLAVPGEIVICIAGKEDLEWRKGNLLFP